MAACEASLRKGVTPYATIPGDWTTGRIGLVLAGTIALKDAPNGFRPDPSEPAFEPPDVESYDTTKLVPEAVSTDVVSWRLPPLDAMSIASFCQAESLIGPLTPLIVADALVNVTVPKLARPAIRFPTVGASTTHSAELCSAMGLCVCAEVGVVVYLSLDRLVSVIVSSK